VTEPTNLRIGVIGVGAVGGRVARQLAGTPGVEVLVMATSTGSAHRLAASIGASARVVSSVEDMGELNAAVLATPVPQHDLAERFVLASVPVVSVSDDREDVWRLWGLDAPARENGVSVVVGAGFAPGISCLMARYSAAAFDTVDEIHVAKHGAGGPACARQHHKALRSTGQIWRAGDWRSRTGGSGRELNWFPNPIGARDCYHAALPDPFLLLRAFPNIDRISARMSATRRDRLTSRLPMMRRPPLEGALGAVRVEVRGSLDGHRHADVLGTVERPAIGAAAMAAVAALHIAVPRIVFGAVSLADEALDTTGLLAALGTRGVKVSRFASQG
jgi:hypothetical protein